MYCLRVKISTLVTIGYIVGFIVGIYIEYCLWAQVAVLDIYCIYWTVWDMYMQVCIWVELPVQRSSARFSEVASGNPTSTCIPRVDG